MSYIFIELFNYTEKWRGTDEDTRRSFIAGISGSLDRMPSTVQLYRKMAWNG